MNFPLINFLWNLQNDPTVRTRTAPRKMNAKKRINFNLNRSSDNDSDKSTSWSTFQVSSSSDQDQSDEQQQLKKVKCDEIKKESDKFDMSLDLEDEVEEVQQIQDPVDVVDLTENSNSPSSNEIAVEPKIDGKDQHASTEIDKNQVDEIVKTEMESINTEQIVDSSTESPKTETEKVTEASNAVDEVDDSAEIEPSAIDQKCDNNDNHLKLDFQAARDDADLEVETIMMEIDRFLNSNYRSWNAWMSC